MGFLSKAWKGIKKVGSKIVGGINKIGDALTGGNWSKWMEKGWVQKAMMAATLLTGGIAIVNGVMQGAAGFTSTAGNFATKFVAGAKDFAAGVGSGLTNPVGEGKKLLGLGGDGLSAVTAQTGASINPATGEAIAPGLAEASASAAGAATPTSSPIQTMLNATEGGASPIINDGLKEVTTDHLSRQVANATAPAAEQNWLQSLKSGAKDFISSPMGMQTAASAVSGWAQGQALEEQWQRMDDERKRKRATWTGFASRAPDFNMDSLQNLRDRRTQMYDRGDIAQAKFGY